MAEGGSTRPSLAVWKFASCDGCQLTLLNCEDELIPLAGAVEIAYFPEATRAVVEGPYDVSLVEGSITTPDELERIQQVRAVSRRVITIGACATSGGIQALRERGVAPDRLRLSMERNMKCGVGLCGHCQLRELFLCVDGPVLGYDRLEPLLMKAEL